MATSEHKSTHAASSGGEKSEKIKMVQRHREFQEVDVEASQAGDVADYSGKNPHREGTAQWMAFENRKREAKGQPFTNNL